MVRGTNSRPGQAKTAGRKRKKVKDDFFEDDDEEAVFMMGSDEDETAKPPQGDGEGEEPYEDETAEQKRLRLGKRPERGVSLENFTHSLNKHRELTLRRIFNQQLTD